MRKTVVAFFATGALFLGAHVPLVEAQQQKASVQVQHTEGGRFQIIMWQGEMPGLHTYLLDTATGRVWHTMRDTDTDVGFWAPMEVLGAEIPWSAEAKFWMKFNKEEGAKAVKKKAEKQP